MFVQKEKKSSRAATRAADAIDLIIEFATLGEYGLEYPEPVRSDDRKQTTPDLRMASVEAPRQGHGASPQKHRHGRRPCRPGRIRVDLPGWGERPGHEVPGVQPGRRHRAATEPHHVGTDPNQAGADPRPGADPHRSTAVLRPAALDDSPSPARKAAKRAARNRPTSALPDALRPPRIRLEAA